MSTHNVAKEMQLRLDTPAFGKTVIACLDDIVFSKDHAEHYKHLQIVLQLLPEY